MYGKIFRQMYKGTLAMVGPWEALVTFQQMIVLADRDGSVDMTADAISRETTIPLHIIQKGLAVLELPDPESRSPDEEGRRIIRLSDARSWGWRIVNYEHYRKMRSEEERREYHRNYYRTKRSKSSTTPQQVSTDSTNSSKQNAVSSKQKEDSPDGVSQSDTSPNSLSASPTAMSAEIENVFKHWKATHNHPRAALDDKRRKLIRAALKSYSEALLCQAITGYLNSPHHMGQNDRNTVYDSIELMLRDNKHIDAGLAFYQSPPSQHSQLTKRNIDSTRDWVPPEMRTHEAK